MAMDPTTLVTFMLRVAPEVRTVELLGSWDNFHQPYRMHHDRRRGTGCWSGCFTFENIVFDGDGVKWSRPRSGGLKQGGTYWYYYQINYDYDFFDDRQPCTTACPLLPGQTVNVMDVPYELVALPQRSQSAHGDIIGSLVQAPDQRQTMDPGEKFALLQPPPVSKVHSRCLSDEALDGRLEKQQQPLVVAEVTDSPLPSPHSHQLPRECVDSKMDHYPAKDDVSRASSVYSQRSTKIGNVSTPYEKETNDGPPKDLGPAVLPNFPSPTGLGPTPSTSFDALGAVLFASAETADILESKRREEDPTSPELSKLTENWLDYSIRPKPAPNIHYYSDSRPGTSPTHDSSQYRSRMYSMPNVEIRDHLDEDIPSVPGSPRSPYSPHLYYNVDENPAPNDERGSFHDLASPTFSAMTISTRGQNTPFSLSAQHSSNGHALDRADDAEPRAIGDHPQAPNDESGSRHRPLTFQPRTFDSRDARRGPRPFVNYSLPTIASESSHSLAKTVSSPCRSPRPQEGPLPPALADGAGTSMAEDIFSQLGF